MIAELVRWWRRIGHSTEPGDLANALYLAPLLGRDVDTTADSPDGDAETDVRENRGGGIADDVPKSDETGVTPAGNRPTISFVPPKRQASADPPTDGRNHDGDEPVNPGQDVAGPGLTLKPSARVRARNLRSLRRRVPGAARELDEASTAEHSAAAESVVPRYRPLAERWLSLVLVIDAGPSMSLWEDDIAQLTRSLDQVKAFARVQSFDVTVALHQLLLLRRSGGDRVRHHPAEFRDQRGRCAYVIYSDCVGDHWQDGRMPQLLRSWGSVGPVAVVQPLPQSLWDRCTPVIRRGVRLDFSKPGISNTRLRPRPDSDVLPPGVPIPVVQSQPRWLQAWAEAVSGQRAGPRNMAVLFTGERRARLPASSSDPAALVSGFQTASSQMASLLAAHLAAAPLTLASMERVRQVARREGQQSPASRANLAEVFLSGLVVVTGDQRDPAALSFDFRPGVRNELLRQLRPSDAMRVLDDLTVFVTSSTGPAMDLATIMTPGRGPDTYPRPVREFAAFAGQLLGGLGSSHRHLADRLLRLAPATDPTEFPFEPTSPDTRVGDDNTSEPPLSRDEDFSQSGDPMSPTVADATDVNAAEPAEQDSPDTEPPYGTQDSAPRVYGGVPVRSTRNFIGRETYLRRIREQLTKTAEPDGHIRPRDLALIGMGGIGKTTIAVEYVRRYASQYDLVWWVVAHDSQTMRRSLVSLAHRLGLHSGQDAEQAIATVIEHLRVPPPDLRRWLLIYDGAPEPEEITSYLPYGTGHILLTSRDPRWEEFMQTVDVGLFEPEESIALLQRRGRGIGRDAAETLAEQLGNLPIAIEQSAAFQAETGTPADECVRLFREHPEEVFGTDPEDTNLVFVSKTWRVTFDSLSTDRAAAGLLQLCAFLGPQPISVPMLASGQMAPEISPELSAALRDEVKLRRAIRTLNRFSLATTDPVRNTLQVHVMLQMAVRAALPDAERAAGRRRAQQVLAAALAGRRPDAEGDRSAFAAVAPHAVAAGVLESDDPAVRNIPVSLIRYYFAIGDYESSRELGEAAVGRWRSRFGESDELTLVASAHLANTLRTAGDWVKARELNRRTEALFISEYGEDSEHTLTIANSIGADLRVAGRLNEAYEYDQRNLERQRRVYADAPERNLILAINNLAVDLRLLGRFEEAQELDLEAIEGWRAITSPQSMDMFLSTTNLARDLYGLGAYDRGLRLLRDRLAELEPNRVSNTHYLIMLAHRSVSVLERKVGNYEEALRIAVDVLESYQQKYGFRHVQTLSAMTTYGNSLRVVGNLPEALEVCTDAFAGYQESLGSQHPFSMVAASNLAIVQRGLKQFDQARTLGEEALAGMSETLGKAHPYYLCCAANVSNDLALAGESESALALSEEVHRQSMSSRGERHPYTYLAAINYSWDLEATGQSAEAERVQQEAVDGLRQVLGSEHPEVVLAERGRRSECDIEPNPI